MGSGGVGQRSIPRLTPGGFYANGHHRSHRSPKRERWDLAALVSDPSPGLRLGAFMRTVTTGLIEARSVSDGNFLHPLLERVILRLLKQSVGPVTDT